MDLSGLGRLQVVGSWPGLGPVLDQGAILDLLVPARGWYHVWDNCPHQRKKTGRNAVPSPFVWMVPGMIAATANRTGKEAMDVHFIPGFGSPGC